MSDGQSASETKKLEQDALADRIAAVLRGRKQIGMEQRIQQRRLQEDAFTQRPKLGSELSEQPAKSGTSLRWNSANGSALG